MTIGCVSCHADGRFKGTPANCIECHQRDYSGTSNPNHSQAGFPTTCQTCHSTAAWNPTTFDHNTFTKYPLTGGHIGVACTLCHVNGRYPGTPTDCASCHIKNYKATTNPNHVQAGFPTPCEQCHTTATWLNSTFNHNNTGFPLTGSHTTLQCAECHINGNYHITDASCVSCHLKNFQDTTNPNHVQAGFPQTCEQCHNTTSWLTATFNHNNTGFPLTGAHVPLQCSQCHIKGNYKITDPSCVSCHLNNYNGTTDPNHVQAKFPTLCQECHSTTNWGGATFNHASTGFALTGAHTALACVSCHVNGNYTLNNAACSACHLTQYNSTTDPNHAKAGFPTTCDTCHTTTAWTGAQFDHTKNTTFPLTGAHVALDCNSCHASGVFKGLPTTCVSCHLTNFNGTTNPNHVTAGYPQTCDLCHTTTAWTPSTFNHSTGPFPLTGAHTTTPCASCHVNNNYTTIPTDCYSCHKAAYTGTTDPNHVAAAFPTTCQDCHTTTSWAGAVFNHTKFPIYSGTHNQSVWVTCSACHTNSTNYQVFSCITCHQHTQSNTDPKHQGVGGYSYTATSCYSWHPTGSGGG